MRCWLGGIAADASALEPSELEPRTRSMARHGSRLLKRGWVTSTGDYRGAAKLRRWFDDTDVLITPVLAHDPPPVRKWDGAGWIRTTLGVARWMGYTTPVNLAQLAAVTVCVGRSPAGLPIGVQLVGTARSQRRLLQLAAELESRHPRPVWQPSMIEG